MKITFFIGGLSGGGAERVICNLCNFLDNKGHECTILTMSEDEPSYFLNSTVRVQFLLRNSERGSMLKNIWLRVYRYWKYLKRSQSECYIVFLPETIILTEMMRYRTKARVIMSERGNPNQYSCIYRFLLKRFSATADEWVFQTEDAMAWYGDNIRSGVVIPNAINPAFVRPQYEGKRLKRIVGAGRLIGQKNFSLLIDAFSKIEKKYPDYSLVIYGEGPLRGQLLAQVEALGLTDKVQFPGYVNNLAEEIEKSTLFVLSSDFEGMPNALMESMALGVPCISTDCPVGGSRHLICNGENGFLVPVGDVHALADAMEQLLSSGELQRKIGQAAHMVCDTHSHEVIYSQWEACLRGGAK